MLAKGHSQHQPLTRGSTRLGRLDNFEHSLLPKLLQPVQLMTVSILARNVGGAATNASAVERWATDPMIARNYAKCVRRTRLFTKEGCLSSLRKRLREL